MGARRLSPIIRCLGLLLGIGMIVYGIYVYDQEKHVRDAVFNDTQQWAVGVMVLGAAFSVICVRGKY
jgi:hypothetical protein